MILERLRARKVHPRAGQSSRQGPQSLARMVAQPSDRGVLDVGKGFFMLSADMGRLDGKADDVTRTVFLDREIEVAYEKSGGR